ncbi:MAG: peptidase asparaginase 2 [Labilithrix sp.]|nr:peptidase asparaginase 2 [Labilithrix sp.]
MCSLRSAIVVLVTAGPPLFVACERPTPPSSDAAPLPRSASTRAAAIAHGGVGSPPKNADGCRAAVDAALHALEAGADPVDAAVAGVVVMEDDPRFNAGTGSRVRLDGVTVQMDASVMRSDGRFAAVAAIEAVKNPVKVARAVMDTPHLVLAGDGATRFARTLGMAPYDPATDESKKRTRELTDKLLAGDPSTPPAWRTFDWRARWNFEAPPPRANDAGSIDARPIDAGSDTVGVAVRAADGRFGVALSTGGTAITLRGRVGDVPILGAGLYAGPYGAAAATGTGERIIELGLARSVHEHLASGMRAEDAAKRAVDALRGKDIGVIVIDRDSMAAAADRDMAWAAREAGASTWSGPTPP